MGVPKFYRWTSERYPCLSEIVKEYQIPEFDNLYLDMNGIIHVCSHPDDANPHFRITEEKIFKDIFHYIEVLFRLIQPRKVFFMAVDGVAPRAKMNQQRGRRFRSAREAEEQEQKAVERGEELPKEARFDSNCITPGTPFMDRLDKQLQFFVSNKITHDRLWQHCKVIYSGHQTPGEGEHKIMEYIRYSKAQPDHDPNTRHCLYGLDADLIMLGLTSHEPHFSLLREEVRFGGKKDQKRTTTPEETTFHLLHLSLMREYIDYEFSSLRELLPFEYCIENIIDDWVFMGFLVGNDFIPHLPHLHINKDALPTLFTTYKEVLPTLDGYLNEGGTLNLKRFEKFMLKLTQFDLEKFDEINADLKYFQGKRAEEGKAFTPRREAENRAKKLEAFQFDDEPFDNAFGALEDLNDDEMEEHVRKTLDKLGISQDPAMNDNETDCSSVASQPEEEDEESIFEAEFRQYKRNYYMSKMDYTRVDAAMLREQAHSYVRGLQWILNYYYNGICSWSWFYPEHYSPCISDIKDFADMDMNFNLGKPFLPFEQLLGVLPPHSIKLLPKAYWSLVLDEGSPLRKFYPQKFETDLNGKQQDWEAVVLIPFLDEKALLEAMKPCNEKLIEDELRRNQHGPMYIYDFTSQNLGEFKAPEYFPSIAVNHAQVTHVYRDEWMIPSHRFIKGLASGVRMDLYFAGFPTLKHLPHTVHIAKEGVKVFQQNSRGENFILQITESPTPPARQAAAQFLDKIVYVAWPHLIEAKVVALSDGKTYFSMVSGQVQESQLENRQRDEFNMSCNHICSHYLNRWGVQTGDTKMLIYAKVMTGRRYIPGHEGRMVLEKEWSSLVQPYAMQMVVRDLAAHDPGLKKYFTVAEFFPPRTKVFMLGHPYYGCMGEVLEAEAEGRALKGRLRISMTVPTEPSLTQIDLNQHTTLFMNSYQAAQKLGMLSHLFSRITGSVFLSPQATPDSMASTENRNKLNIGLNLKSNAKSEEVAGYTQRPKDTTQWLYSDRVVEAVREYQQKFPEVLDHLSANIDSKDFFYQDQVFPEEKCKERVAELTAWLKEVACAKAERRPCGTVSAEETLVPVVIEEVNKVKSIRAKAIKMQVRPHLLFKPSSLQGSSPPDPSVQFELLDRIINVREGFSVPLGARGTIIGIRPAGKEVDTVYDILFDETFAGGLKLAGEASVQRCYRLHRAAIINVSFGERKTISNSFQTASTKTKKNGHGQQQPSSGNRWKLQPQEQQQQQYLGPAWQKKHQGPPPSLGTQSLTLDDLVPITSASEVPCLVHGTYYCYWSSISQHGLQAKDASHPIRLHIGKPRTDTGPKAFQLHIYLDVALALTHGVHLARRKSGQVLSLGDAQGRISPKYFAKVVDLTNNQVIYSSQYAATKDSIGPEGVKIKGQQGLHGLGRGKGMTAPGTPQGMHVFHNIWQQMQSLDHNQQPQSHPESQLQQHPQLQQQQQPKHLSQTRHQPKVATDASQLLSAILNISSDDSTCSSSHSSQPTGSSHRKEVSVQELFMSQMGTLAGNGNNSSMGPGRGGGSHSKPGAQSHQPSSVFNPVFPVYGHHQYPNTNQQQYHNSNMNQQHHSHRHSHHQESFKPKTQGNQQGFRKVKESQPMLDGAAAQAVIYPHLQNRQTQPRLQESSQNNSHPFQQGNRASTSFAMRPNPPGEAQTSSSSLLGVEVNSECLKATSPVKSAFVPTQVIRNQTPRKAKDREESNCLDEASTSAVTRVLQCGQGLGAHSEGMVDNEGRKPDGAGNAHQHQNKPRKQGRNRLAVKFAYDK
ncbi:5'-3' exoribonuclease 1-like isoform X2 [Oratosquilla oratoria]|uniref:5'-3' exoribonuclease 1-like isoform X2 n=1 Tax=Oratosquilla oratoria TaxID=337810 RepID=UPI003F772AF5